MQAVEWAGGTIDLLVNNAGIVVLEDFMDVTVENFDEAIAVNTRAPLLVSQVIQRLGWVGLGWVGLGWVGLGWGGVGCIGLDGLVGVCPRSVLGENYVIAGAE